MTVFPAVFLENLPIFLRENEKKTASILLGRERTGIIFWRLHPSLPNFLVVFRAREDRDAFYNSKLLQEVRNDSLSLLVSMRDPQAVVRDGVSANCRLYCKNSDKLLDTDSPSQQEGWGVKQLQQRVSWRDHGRGQQEGRKEQQQGGRREEERGLDLRGPRARLYMSVDKVVAACGKDVLSSNVPPRPTVASTRTSKQPSAREPPYRPGPPARGVAALLPAAPSPSAGVTQFRPSQLRTKVADKSLLQANMFSRPPPPIKEAPVEVPEVKRDVLEELKEAIVEYLGAGKEAVAKAVSESWRGQEETLAKIYGEILESQESESQDATVVRRQLGEVYRGGGTGLVTRDKVGEMGDSNGF